MSRLIKRVQYDPLEEGSSIDVFYTETIEVNGEIIEIGNLLKKTISLEVGNSIYDNLMTYIQTQVDEEELGTSTPKPNWGLFNLSIFPLANYQLLRSESSNIDARNMMEITAITCGVSRKDLDPAGYLFLQSQWNLFIEGLTNSPSAEVIEDINNVMILSNMKFRLNSAGLLEFIDN